MLSVCIVVGHSSLIHVQLNSNDNARHDTISDDVLCECNASCPYPKTLSDFEFGEMCSAIA